MAEGDRKDVVANTLAAIVDSSDDAIIGKDLQGTITSWNRGAETIFGFSAEQMIGSSILRIIPPDRLDEEAHIMARIRRGERVPPFDTQRLRVDRRLIDVSVTASPIRTSAGEVIGVSKIARDISERARADATASRLAAIVDSSDDAIVGKTLTGVVTSWNRGAERLFGYSADEMLGRAITRIIPADRLPEEERLLDQIARGEVVAPFDTRRQRKDGALIDVSVTASPIRNQSGSIVGVSKIARDITAQKRADDARRQAEGRYRTLFEHAPDGIVITGPDQRIVDANASLCRLLGCQRDDLLGLHIGAFMIGGGLDGAAAHRPDRVEPYRTLQLRRRDGVELTAEVAATAMPDGLTLTTVRDISERLRATEALRAAEERMRFALEAAGVGIWDLDYNSGDLQWSPILEAQYGFAPGTFRGTYEAGVERIHADDRAAVAEALATAVRSGTDFTVVHRVVLPDGSIRWLRGAGRVRVDERGTPVRGVGISLDITEHRSLEAQFQQAQKMEALGRLAGGVAHDFNNLLTAILGYCELLLVDLPADDPRRDDVDQIRSAGNKAAGLTRQLLAFSRKQIIEPTLVDLNVVISEMQPLLQRLIGEDVDIAVNVAPGLSPVMADRGQVEQVLMNLAVNARDAMPNGGRLTVATADVQLDEHAATHRALMPGAYVALRVTDTGAGMTPDVQARMFEPFFTTKEAGKGTGLGMATVHGIVARSGGSVGVYSEVGRGTSVNAYFPAARDGERAADVPAPAPRRRTRAATVLVVDDADTLRELTQRLLERHGFTVLTAANAGEALSKFEAHPAIDLIVTDVVMPGASGPDLTRQLTEKRPGLRVLYMSGYTEDAIVHHGVLVPGVSFVHKPFTSDSLIRKIDEVLGRVE